MTTVVERVSRPIASDLWTRLTDRVYECRVWLCPEREGGFSALVPSLPGVASQGETEEEALENVKEAFQGAVAEYLDSGERIPWCRDIVRQKPNDAKEKWILVNV